MATPIKNWLAVGGITVATAITGIEGADRLIETPVEREIKYATAVTLADAQARAEIQAEEVAFRAVGEEVKSKRTETVAVYKGPMVTDERGTAQQFTAHVFSAPKYFHDPDGDSLMALDVTVRAIEPPTVMEKAVEELKGVVGIKTPQPTHNRYVKAGPYAAMWFAEKPYDYTIATMTGQEQVQFTALHDTTSMSVETVPTSKGMKQTWVLTGSRASKVLQWKVASTAPMIHDGGRVLAGKFIITEPVAWDADSLFVPVAVSVKGDTLTYDVKTANAKYPITVDPTTESVTGINGGYFYENSGMYSTVQTRTTANSAFQTDRIAVGQQYSTLYYIRRGVLCFPDIPYMASCSACTLFAYGQYDRSVVDFSIKVGMASLVSPAVDAADYGKLSPGSAWLGSYETLNYSATWNAIPFVAAGRDSLITVRGDSAWMSLWSARDYAQTQPSTNDEYVEFDGTGAAHPPYLSLTYVPGYPLTPTDLEVHTPTATSLRLSWTNRHSADVDSVTVYTTTNAWVKKLANDDTATTITGLTPNVLGAYVVRIDSGGTTGYSVADSLYTLAAAPTADFAELYTDSTKITIGIAANGNSAATTYAIRDSTNQKWIDASGNATVTKTWRTAAQWATTATINGQNASIRHLLGVVAKNGDGIETVYSWQELTIGNAKYRELSALDHYTHRYKHATYATSRNDTTWANIYSTATDDTIGQRLAAGDSTVLRASYSFAIPVMDNVLACSLKVAGVNDQSATDFRLYAVTGAVLPNSIPSNLWKTTDNTARRHFAFSGFDTGAFAAANMLRAWSTSSYGASIKVPFTLSGLISVYIVRGDTLRLTVSSSADSALTRANGYIVTNTPKLGLWYVYTDKVPSNLIVTAIDKDSLLVTWTDNSYSETGFALVDAYTGLRIGGDDSTAADATSKRMGGLLPNKVYNIKVKVLGGKIADDVSTSQDSARTWAATLGKPTVIVSGANSWDESGNSRHGTSNAVRLHRHTAADTSAAGRAFGGYGAYDFNGTTSYINAGTDCIGTGPVTVCGWVKAEGLGENTIGVILHNGKTAVYWNGAYNRLEFSRDGIVTGVSAATASLPAGQWGFASITSDQFGTTNFRINGAASGAANQSSGTPAAATTDLYIGNRAAGDRTFDGLLDDLRIYNRVLSVAEQDSLYQYGVCNDYQVGPELITNGDFSAWSGAADPNNTPTGWTITGRDANNYWQNASGALRVIGNGAAMYGTNISFEAGKTYQLSALVTAVVAGYVRTTKGTTLIAQYESPGQYTVNNGPMVTVTNRLYAAVGTPTDVTIDNVSVREVIPGSSLALWYMFDVPVGYVKIALPTSTNPASTKYALYDSLSQKFVMPVPGGIDTMRAGTVDSSWAWQTYSLWGAALGDTVRFPVGNRSAFQIYSKNSP